MSRTLGFYSYNTAARPPGLSFKLIQSQAEVTVEGWRCCTDHTLRTSLGFMESKKMLDMVAQRSDRSACS